MKSSFALRFTPNLKCYVTGKTEWTYPTSAAMSGEILVPQDLETLGQGITLEMQCLAMDTTGMEIEFALSYDLAKPEFPLASGEGEALLTPDSVRIYRIDHLQKVKLQPNAWTSLKELPFAPILGLENPAAKDQSCYLFARAIPVVR